MQAAIRCTTFKNETEKMKICKFYYLILIFIFFSCSAQNKAGKINTKINKEYSKSRKGFYGKLSEEEFRETRKTIVAELKTEIPEKNVILINYYQKGDNCFAYGFGEKSAQTEIENSIKMSARFSTNYNMSDFFIFSSDCIGKESVERRKNFILDSGFFTNNIFTLKENCRAFFLLKPNGEFMKYYGSDYFSEMRNFLEIK